jgi:hypothetical protein
MNKIEQLEAEIRRKEVELEELRNLLYLPSSAIKEVGEFTEEEMCKWFAVVYGSVRGTLRNMESGRWHEDNDDAHYLWDTCWGMLAKDEVKFKQYVKSLTEQ